MPLLLETPRTILEEPTSDQIDLVYPLFSDPDVLRYVGTGEARSRDQTVESIERNRRHWDAFGFGFFNAFEKKTGAFIGRCGLIHLGFSHENPEVEVGYILHKAFWGKGFATEIAQCLLDWAFANLELDTVYGVTYIENQASKRVLAKVGMVFDRQDIYPGNQLLADFFRKDRTLS